MTVRAGHEDVEALVEKVRGCIPVEYDVGVFEFDDMDLDGARAALDSLAAVVDRQQEALKEALDWNQAMNTQSKWLVSAVGEALRDPLKLHENGVFRQRMESHVQAVKELWT